MEAMILLVVARLLIMLIPIRYWRASLGQPTASRSSFSMVGDPAVRSVIRAVKRAAGSLPLSLACLPRAMAVQWMLARRCIPSVFIIGVAEATDAKQAPPLHAWVEAGGRVVIGEETSRFYRSNLTLQHGGLR